MTTRPAVQLAAPHTSVGSASPGWWGMVLLIVTEATLFGALVSAYFYLRFLTPQWPPDGIARPELLWPSIGSVVLIGSSLPMHLADRAARRGEGGRLRVWLLIALVLGIAFLGIQVSEYMRADFSPQTNAYGSLFFTITAFHGLHVLGALLFNLGLQALAWLRGASVRVATSVHNVALYWHFVDAVWVVIFAALYLSLYLG